MHKSDAAPGQRLPKPVELLRLVLLPERQSIPAIYEQLRWEHKDLEDVINTHWDDLPRAGIRLHVATKDVASSQRWKVVEVDGRRYSAISLDTAKE